MRRYGAVCGVFLILVAMSSGCALQAPVETEAELLRGPYFGQTPPGDTPQIFAPGFLPDIGYEHTATMFTVDGEQAFWGRVINPGVSPRCHVIMHAQQVDGVWSAPELAPFNIGINSFIDSVSPDGTRVFFQAHEKVEKDGGVQRRWTNWVVHRTVSGWDEPRLLEESFSWDNKFFDFQVTNSGNRYFTSNLEGSEREIGLFSSRFVDGSYEDPQPLGPTVNSESLDYAFYVDPDEEFIVFASTRPGAFDGTELYISFHQLDDSWGPALSLEKINAVFEGGISWPYLSPDGKYLFFVASVDAYEDADVEEGTYEQLRAISQSPDNGYLKVYWVSTSFIEELGLATS